MAFTAGYEHGTNTNTLMNSWNEKLIKMRFDQNNGKWRKVNEPARQLEFKHNQYISIRFGLVLWFIEWRRVWRYQRGNRNPWIEEEQTTQWPKEKEQKYKQRSTKYTYKTKDRVTRTPLKTGGELRCSGRVSSSKIMYQLYYQGVQNVATLRKYFLPWEIEPIILVLNCTLLSIYMYDF